MGGQPPPAWDMAEEGVWSPLPLPSGSGSPSSPITLLAIHAWVRHGDVHSCPSTGASPKLLSAVRFRKFATKRPPCIETDCDVFFLNKPNFRPQPMLSYCP